MMPNFRPGAAILAAGALLLVAEQAHAGAADVVACKDIAGKEERLACYDRTVVGLAQDLKESDGFSLFGLFGPGGKTTSEKDFGAKAGAPAGSGVPEVTSVSAKLQGISFDKTGKPVFILENGQVWRAQEHAKIRLKGDGTDSATVKRSMTGLGYLIRVNDLSYDIGVTRER